MNGVARSPAAREAPGPAHRPASRPAAPRPEAPPPLASRYEPMHLGAFTDEELRRFLAPLGLEPAEVAAGGEAWRRAAPALAWELLYRVEPDLYVRLTAGERLHPGILAWLPERIGTAVEVGAGWGRLTLDLAPRCRRLVAVEPAGPMRGFLGSNLAGHASVEVVPGFFDDLPVASAAADLVIACSSFTADPAHGGDTGLAEMERVCSPGGLVVVVWPDQPEWLVDRGFAAVAFEGDMAVEYPSAEEAAELARIFWPDAADEVERRGDRRVPYEVLGVPAPRSLCWRRRAA